MSVRPTISVALCTCNGARFITEQVNSILGQTLPAEELVVYDDASSDDTVLRIRAAWDTWKARPGARGTQQQSLPVLRIETNKQRLGVAANFSRAISACRGELIALSDQDDVWHANRLSQAVARVQAEPKRLLLHANARLIDAGGQALGLTLFDALSMTKAELDAIAAGNAFKVLLDRNVITGAATLFRRSLLTHAQPIPPHWLHDEWLGVIAAALGGVGIETEPLIDYRQHGDNQIGAARKTVMNEIKRAVASRGDWHVRRHARAAELAARLRQMGQLVPPALLAMADEKVEHHRARAALPQSRWLRAWPLLQEWSTGRYRRFGRGMRGVVKDLLEAP
ncbi:MAG: putative glycosyltransferase, family 2 [Polaromonas sp.]|nr:putative glycosyltransferase, family 2 [Polaromonas sp.]